MATKATQTYKDANLNDEPLSNRLLKNASVFFLDLFFFLLMLIAERVLPKRQASAIKQNVLFEACRHVGLPLHGS